ncbi:hypothetical protein BDV40DRAFT_278039 [Aspergillus tamarii]|uniref:Uncharacterized protein n=1 Tax=Aspergillus tamarii TaxID=41984 RepID=A0A5N6UFW1_ASPTM|nr:hypothetical protein BDV40DRAFT_278039 [Aspergillus tamarii]
MLIRLSISASCCSPSFPFFISFGVNLAVFSGTANNSPVNCFWLLKANPVYRLGDGYRIFLVPSSRSCSSVELLYSDM